MTDDLTFEELPPGRYNGTVEKIRYGFRDDASPSPTKLDMPGGEVRHRRGSPIGFPVGSLHLTALGKGG